MSSVVPRAAENQAVPGSKPRPRVMVIRGTYLAHVLELGIFERLARYGFDPHLVGARKTTYRDDEVKMPVHRLRVPAISGPLSKTLAGGYLIGRVSEYRYFHEYLLGFDRAVEGADILCPIDLGHPTSYQCLKHRPKCKVIVQCWENIPFNWPEDRPLARHYRAVLEQADLFLPFTQESDRVLRLEGVEASRRAQVYSGLDLKVFRPPSPAERTAARSALGAGPDEVIASYIARVDFSKGIFTTLEAMVDTDRRVKLHVFGGGKQGAAAQARAHNLGLDGRVKFWGPLKHEEVLARGMWGADMLVVPSIPTEQWREQLGQIHLEGIAAAVPVVATRSGSIPEVVKDGITGLTVAADMAVDVAEAMNRLAADPNLRKRLGSAGRKLAEETFDVEKNAPKLAAILWERGLGRSPPSPVPS